MMVRLSLVYATFTLIAVSHGVGATSFLCKNFMEQFIDKLYPSVNENDIQFYFYTKEHSKYENIRYNEKNVKNIKFNPSRKTTIIIHGFVNDHNAGWIQNMIKKLLDWEDMNVIAVDWSRIFSTSLVNYNEAAKKTEQIADKIYKLLLNLAKVYNKDLKDWSYLHFIGHSLGAHTMGQVAKKLKPSVYVHRITGFDPAKPYFDGEGAHLQLNKSVAQFVDVIHTNTNAEEKTFGLYEPLGHVDFYPNGGDRQPGCSRKKRTFHQDEISKCFSYLFFGLDLTTLYSSLMSRKKDGDDMICNHEQGQMYFIKSINRKSKFIAYKINLPIRENETKCSIRNCSKETCVEMGINAALYSDPKYHGTYYLDIPDCNSN